MPETGDDIAKRSRILALIIENPSIWKSWLVGKPRSFSEVLGVCDQGARTLEEEIAPILARIFQQHQSQGGIPMPDNKKPPANTPKGEPQPPPLPVAPGEGYAQLANSLINLLTVGLKEKKKIDRLKALAKSWEKCGDLKSELLSKWEDGNVPKAKKKIAKEIHKQLEDLQKKLKAIYEKIDKGDDTTNDVIEANTLAGEIKGLLIVLVN